MNTLEHPRNKRDAMLLTPEQIAQTMQEALAHLQMVEATVVADDDRSTWEFNSAAWNSDSSTCVSSESSSSSSSSPTPAQDVAHRYRAGLHIDLGPARSSSQSTEENNSSADDADCSSFESTDTLSTLSSLSLSIPFQQQCLLNARPLYRESRANALLDIRDEAHAIMTRDNLLPSDPIVCHRPDCRDTLPGLRAFIYHLHIHNMHDRLQMWECDACGGAYETRRELRMHACAARGAKSEPCSPIRDTFMRVLSRIKSRE